MKREKKTIRYGLVSCLLASALCIGGGVASVSAQNVSEAKRPLTKQVTSGRDPFTKYEAPRVVGRKNGQVVPPSIQERIAQYKAQKQAAMVARLAAPKPTTALLLNELQVIGISRTPRGYAAIVEASPIKLSYVIYPGERFYDGQLVAIEESRLRFRRETVFGDGRREWSEEIKSLRQPNSVDPMSAIRASSAGTQETDSAKRADNKPATTEKP